jgi:hypothetical protein
MSRSHPRGRWTPLAAFAVAAGLALAGSGRAQDLDRFQAKEAISAQKTVSDIRNLLAAARKQEGKDPARAKVLLQQARRQLDNATGLPEGDRVALDRQIRAGLRSVEATVREQGVQAKTAADRDAVKQAERGRQRDVEAKGKQAIGFNKTEDMIKGARGTLSQYEKLKLQRETGVVGATREIYESASIMSEQRFNKERSQWLDKYRPTSKLTAKEKELLKMLNSVLSVNWDKTPLKDALEYLQDKTGQSILVDENSLREAMVEYDDPVTLKQKKLTVRVILKKILADKGLTYVIKDATIHVMTPEKAKSYMVTRAYPIGDLIPVYMQQMGPFLNTARQAQGLRQLVQSIIDTVDPASWQANGGSGTIGFHAPSMSLIIRQSAEIHYQMGGSLSR